MKKLSILLVLICFVFIISGCSGELGEKYWETISAQSQEVFLSEDFDKAYNITYSYNINAIMNASYGADYAELKTVFEPIFQSAISYAKNHHGDLTIANNTNDEFKKLVYDLKKDLDDFNAQLKTFNKAKDNYQSNITFNTEQKATSNIEKTRLLKFKREYITLIEKAKALSDSVFEARRVGCYDFSDYSTEAELISPNVDVALAINATNLQIVDVSIKVVRAFNAKSQASEYSNYYSAAKDYYNTFIKAYDNNELTLTDDIKSKLNIWQGAYDIFKEDVIQFNNVLSQLDLNLLKKQNYDAEKYANQTGDAQDINRVNYFNEFYKKLSYLKEYSLILFN